MILSIIKLCAVIYMTIGLFYTIHKLRRRYETGAAMSVGDIIADLFLGIVIAPLFLILDFKIQKNKK